MKRKILLLPGDGIGTEIVASQVQLSGRIAQLLPFIKKFDPESRIFYTIKHTKIDSDLLVGLISVAELVLI